MNKIVISVLLILSTAVLASKPLSVPGLFTIHDDQQIARLFLFDQALFAGQIPPRWVEGLGFGFGYPLFVFYPPLAYSVGELIHLFGFGFIASIKIVFFLSIFLSGISMYILARYLFGSFAAIVGSVFYLLVPYRALDVYVRGALAESFAFIWPPLIIWAFLKIFRSPTLKNSIITGVVLSLLMLTHNLIFLPFMIILSTLILVLLSMSNKKRSFLVCSLLAFTFAGLLSAFFWVPALAEKKFTIVDDLLIINLASYKIHYVYPTQLWNWSWGFGGSAEGLSDGISFKIGKLHVLVSALAFIFSIIYLFAKNKFNSEEKFSLHITILFFLLCAFSAFMTTFYSKPIWDLITPLSYLQFPWRFLTFTALFSSILAASFIYLLKISVLKILTSIVLIILLLVTNLKLFKPQFYREDLTDEIATSRENILWDVSLSSFEYIPKGVELIKNDKGANTLNISKADIPETKIKSTDTISNLSDKTGELKFTVKSAEESETVVNTFDFPGWQLFVNGQKREYTSNNKFKLITINLEEGVSDVRLKFNNTPVRSTSNIISAVSFLALMVYFGKRWLTLNRK